MENTNNNNTNQKDDFITRRVNDFLKITNAVGKDAKNVIITFCLVIIGYLGNKVLDLSGQITEEVRKQLPSEVRKVTTEELREPKSKIDSTITIIKESLNVPKDTEEDTKDE